MDIKSLASSSAGNCYLLQENNQTLLLECGINIKDIRKSLNFKISSLDGCLVTHSHSDHSKEVKKVIKYGINVYTSQGTQDVLNLDSHRIKTIKSLEQFNIKDWTILPFDVVHDDPEPLNFFIQSPAGEKLVYITDTMYVKQKFAELNYIMIECNHSREILNQKVKDGVISPQQKKRIIQTHFGLEQVIKFLKANDLSQVREIWLLHLSNRNSDAEEFKREIQAATGKMIFVADKG